MGIVLRRIQSRGSRSGWLTSLPERSCGTSSSVSQTGREPPPACCNTPAGAGDDPRQLGWARGGIICSGPSADAAGTSPQAVVGAGWHHLLQHRRGLKSGWPACSTCPL